MNIVLIGDIEVLNFNLFLLILTLSLLILVIVQLFKVINCLLINL